MMPNTYDPYDPSIVMLPPNDHDDHDLTPAERDRAHCIMALMGCLTYIASLIIGLIVCLFIGSCTPTRTVTSTESRAVSDRLEQIDSLLRLKSVVTQDSVWRESVMRQFQSIRERSDTSRTQVVDSAGRVIREKVIINNVRESVSETDRLEIQKLSSRIEMMDSTIRLLREQLSHSDTLQQQRETVVEPSSRLSWWERAKLRMTDYLLYLLAAIGAFLAFRAKFRKK